MNKQDILSNCWSPTLAYGVIAGRLVLCAFFMMYFQGRNIDGTFISACGSLMMVVLVGIIASSLVCNYQTAQFSWILVGLLIIVNMCSLSMSWAVLLPQSLRTPPQPQAQPQPQP
jgi:hypothetical protein